MSVIILPVKVLLWLNSQDARAVLSHLNAGFQNHLVWEAKVYPSWSSQEAIMSSWSLSFRWNSVRRHSTSFHAVRQHQDVRASLANQIEKAAGTSKHMRETLKQAKKYTVGQVRSQLRSRRRRSKSARRRIEHQNVVRRMGSRKTRCIRLEHSYGAILT